MEIKNEEHFDKVIGKLIWDTNSYISDRFVELENQVKEMLDKYQDSEKALVLITKWSLSFNSSDVHYDMHEDYVQLRFRIDGNLADIFTLNKQQYKLTLERLKYKSDLKMNITNIPQDWKYRVSDENRRIDVRISTLPIKLVFNVLRYAIFLSTASFLES